jgi:hypothetical protein
MRRTVILAIVVVLAMTLGGIAIAGAGAGSQEVALRPGGATCVAPGGSTGGGDAVGFVVMNSAGKPGTANKLIFNIQLQNGAPDTTYEVRVHRTGDTPNCGNAPPDGPQPVRGTFTTNGNGHGHANVQVNGFDLAGGPYNYFVTLNDASGPVPPAEYSSEAAALD